MKNLIKPSLLQVQRFGNNGREAANKATRMQTEGKRTGAPFFCVIFLTAEPGLNRINGEFFLLDD